MSLEKTIQNLKSYSPLLKQNLMGVEKEGLRVSRRGGLSQAKHPKALGCALTHPNITTDFAESLVELVTPTFSSADAMLNFLADTQHYLYMHLPKDQSFWPASMPCVIRGETYIPIAKYGSSNRGRMKSVYRKGLANRYGSVMQTIAGIHFNYSFADEFWQKYQELLNDDQDLTAFKNEHYMSLSRNVVRYGWLIPYLFGSSPAVCKSFLKGYHQHSLLEFNDTTLYEPYATSLRMGDIGYQNLAEDEAGVKANYNSLEHYIHSLKDAIETPAPEYEKIGVNIDGNYEQLNANILQIENEYYSSVRPKPICDSSKKPLNALKESGIKYIELRSLDINTMLSLGIDSQQVKFLESFLLFCLLEESPVISTREQFEIDNNNQLVAHMGRKPGLLLKSRSAEVSLQDWGSELIVKIKNCAQLFSKEHVDAVTVIGRRVDNPDSTPSALALEEMRNRSQGFFDHTNSYAKKHRREFITREINNEHFAYLDKQAINSCIEQKNIEQADNISFDQYLENYFANE